VLATDAASEGLNLQVASFLVNYDLPWNPMRVEQRIGRLDRIGQEAPVVMVRNYVIPGTVEDDVYAALASRIDVFSGVVGKLQPILGATEEAFRRMFRVPRSERAQAERETIGDLLAQVDALEQSGIDLGDEDALPIPEYAESPVTLEDLRRVLTEELDVALDRPERPVTFAPERTSRDPERWCALGTYGHPELQRALEHRAGSEGDDALVIREMGRVAVAYRADRSPPEPVRRLPDLVDLGPAVAAGEAETRARREAETAARAFDERARTVELARRREWEGEIGTRFRRLVAQVIRAEQVLRRHGDGEEPSANLVWMDVCQDDSIGWRTPTCSASTSGWSSLSFYHAALLVPTIVMNAS
jgi:hypothetical protein